MANMLESLNGEFDVFSVAIDVALVFALYPAIKGFIAVAAANMTPTEVLISALIPLVIVLALVYSVAKSTGLMH